MSITRGGPSIVMTALNDEVAERMRLTSLCIIGTGMTLAQRLTIQDSHGYVIADHYIANANENAEFILSPQMVNGVKLTAVPAAGTWTVVLRKG